MMKAASLFLLCLSLMSCGPVHTEPEPAEEQKPSSRHIGQIASVIKIYLTTLNLDKKEEAKEKIEESSKLIKQLLKDLR